MQRQTKESKVFEAIDAMETNSTLDKVAVIKRIWGHHDHFVSRSFDVFFNKAKKALPDKKFKSIMGEITRLE
jgi:hypothetical protein